MGNENINELPRSKLTGYQNTIRATGHCAASCGVFTLRENKTIKSLIVVTFLFTLQGCATLSTTTTVKDDIQIGSPKGYIEFYKFQLMSVPVRLSSIQKNKRIVEGEMKGVSVLRLAKNPGDYTFYVQFDDATTNVNVSIIEGMVTPIFISVIIYEAIRRVPYGYMIPYALSANVLENLNSEVLPIVKTKRGVG